MSEKTESFDAFLSHWLNERIQKLGEVDPVDRVLRAADERLLPIVMTAATAGLGLLPLALSFGARGSELEALMALIVCGGLFTSTTLNLLVLPTIYIWRIRRSHR